MHRREFLIRGSMGGIAAIGKFKKTPLETKTEKGPHHLNPELQKQFGYLEQELGKDFFEAILRLSSIQTTQERKLLLRPDNLKKLHRQRLASIHLEGFPLPQEAVYEIITRAIPEACLLNIKKIYYDQAYAGLIGCRVGEGTEQEIIFGKYISVFKTDQVQNLIGAILHEVGHSLGPTSNKALTLKERLEHAHLLVQRIKSGNFDKRYFPYEQKELCRQLDEYSANMFREFLTIGFAYMEKEDDEIVRFVLQKMIPNLNEAADKALEVQTTIIRQDKTRVE